MGLSISIGASKRFGELHKAVIHGEKGKVRG